MEGNHRLKWLMTLAAMRLGGVNLIFDVLVDRVLGKKPSVAGHFLTSSSIVIDYFYKLTVYVLFIIYSLNIYNGFNEKIINCIDGYNASEPSTDVYYFCLAYPYVNVNKNEKTYILFYKWVPWIILFCGIMFYIPKTLVRSCSCTHTSNFLCKTAERNVDVKDICSFLNKNWDTFHGIYISALLCHIFTLAINAGVFFMLDFCLQGRFFSYVPRTYPFNRNPFSDEIMTTFPPFALCDVNTQNIIFGRDDIYKCHLFLMDYYEKIFLGLWLWIVFLTIITILYILFLLSLNICFVKTWIYFDNNAAGVGNIFVLYKLKKLLTIKQYEKVIHSIEKGGKGGEKTQLLTSDNIHISTKQNITGSPNVKSVVCN